MACVSGFISCSHLASQLDKCCHAKLGCIQRQKSLEGEEQLFAINNVKSGETTAASQAVRLLQDGGVLQLLGCM